VRHSRLSVVTSPESIASILVAVLAVALVASQVGVSASALPRGSASPGPTSSTSSASGAPEATFPPLIRSALESLLIVNARLGDDATALREAIAVRPPVAEDIAAILRRINTDMTVGYEAANRLLTQPETDELGLALIGFYDRVSGQIADTLGTSIRNVTAYVEGATKVIAILADLGPLNNRVRAAIEAATNAPSPSVPAASPSPSSPPSPPPSPTPSPSASPIGGPSPTPPAGSGGPFDGGLVGNGGFEEDLSGWRLLVTLPAAATVALEPGGGIGGTTAARIDIATGSDARSGISFVTGGIPLRQGASYTVSVAVRAAAAREIRVQVAGADGLTYAPRVFTVGPTWTVVTFNLTQVVDDPAAELRLDLGRSAETVWFDNVGLSESPG
jgi:hypothetical protein